MAKDEMKSDYSAAFSLAKQLGALHKNPFVQQVMQQESYIKTQQQENEYKMQQMMESLLSGNIPQTSGGQNTISSPEPSMSSPFMKVDVSLPKGAVNLNEPTTPGFHRILVMGDSGTGKTHFAGTMPTPFVADFDRGLATLRGKDVMAVTYGPDDWNDFKQEVQRWRKDGPKYERETFVLDSLTTAADAAMNAVLKKNNRTQSAITIADWGEAIREVKDMLGFLTTLNCHVLVVAHSQLVKDEILGDIQYVPLVFGRELPYRIGIYFDEVYSTTVQSRIVGGKQATDYRLQVKPDARRAMLKSRLNIDGKLFETYEEPDYGKLVSKSG